jgi:hypothetical protein
MAHAGVFVFTGKSASMMIDAGGSWSWVANPGRLLSCDYLVCTWNAHSRIGEAEDATNGEGFLVAHISGVEPHPRDPIPSRANLTGWMIKFDGTRSSVLPMLGEEAEIPSGTSRMSSSTSISSSMSCAGMTLRDRFPPLQTRPDERS